MHLEVENKHVISNIAYPPPLDEIRPIWNLGGIWESEKKPYLGMGFRRQNHGLQDRGQGWEPSLLVTMKQMVTELCTCLQRVSVNHDFTAIQVTERGWTPGCQNSLVIMASGCCSHTTLHSSQRAPPLASNLRSQSRAQELLHKLLHL